MSMILSIYFLKLAVCSSFGVENLCPKQIVYWKRCKNYGGGGRGVSVFVFGFGLKVLTLELLWFCCPKLSD